MFEHIVLWRAQITQNADGSPKGLLTGLAGRPDREPGHQVMARIPEHGLPDPAGQTWQFPDVLARRDELRRDPTLYSSADVGHIRGFFATGDRETAHWYAGRYGLADAVIVEFDASLGAVIVDCRDFLDRVFLFAESFIQKGESERLAPMRACIRRYWGDAVLDYFDRLGAGIGAGPLVNAAAHDRVVKAHLANSIVLEGRSGVCFRNQVAVLERIAPAQIRSMEPAVEVTLVPGERLQSLLWP